MSKILNDTDNVKEILKKYWDERGIPDITKRIPSCSVDEKKGLVYYHSFVNPEKSEIFQYSYLTEEAIPEDRKQKSSIRSFQRLNKSGKQKFHLYIPFKWSFYKRQTLHIFEGIPDTLTPICGLQAHRKLP